MATCSVPAIVLVDDEPAVLAILSRVVSRLLPDYDVIAVSDGGAALAEIARRPVELVITDQQLKGMDGVEVIAALRLLAPHCPIVLISGNLSPELEDQAHAAGANFYVSKPFQINELREVIQTALTPKARTVGE